jgi:branched-chain amino acid transport system substrate-binding protein
MEEGAQFAIDQINASGGVLGRQLELKTIDMRNDVAEGAKVTQQLIDEGAVYLIGTVGDGILAEGSVACAAGVPISTGLGTAPSLVGDMGSCAYQLVMSDNIQAAVLAEYAVAQGYQTAYTLGSSEIPYTKNLPIYFTDAFEHAGGTVVGSDEYKIGAGDYSAVVTKLQNADPTPDVVFTPMFIPDSIVFLRQLRQAGLTMPVLSTDGNADAALLDAGAKAIDGLTFTNSVCTAEGDPGVAGLRGLQRRVRQGPELLRGGDRLRRGQHPEVRHRTGEQRRSGRHHRGVGERGLHRDLGTCGHGSVDTARGQAGGDRPDGRGDVHLPAPTALPSYVPPA